jgi:threonine/homoserine/homoserine lactone efflux protein
MEGSLTPGTVVAVFGTMIVLATIPGASALLVSARSATSGFAHGAATTIGIVTGDIIFIAIAVFGLSALANALGDSFTMVKYLGGIYLLWMGAHLCWSRSAPQNSGESKQVALTSSFLSGLLITLADQKAVLFYLGFFPVFIDFSRLSNVDIGILVVTASFAVAIPKLIYAYFADKTRVAAPGTNLARWLNPAAGFVMIAVGIFLLVKA